MVSPVFFISLGIIFFYISYYDQNFIATNKSKSYAEKYQKSLGFFRIHISLSKKMELVFTFWHKIFNSYLINQTKP